MWFFEIWGCSLFNFVFQSTFDCQQQNQQQQQHTDTFNKCACWYSKQNLKWLLKISNHLRNDFLSVVPRCCCCCWCFSSQKRSHMMVIFHKSQIENLWHFERMLLCFFSSSFCRVKKRETCIFTVDCNDKILCCGCCKRERREEAWIRCNLTKSVSKFVDTVGKCAGAHVRGSN